MSDFVTRFHEAMAASGVVTDATVVPDGILRRFHVHGDRLGSQNGWAVLFSDSVPCGAFGSWKSGVHQRWSSKSWRQMTATEKQEYANSIALAKRAKQEVDQRRHQEAATRAQAIWECTGAVHNEHPYTAAKGITPYTAGQSGQSLVLPAIDFSGVITTLQFINPDGGKRLLAGGRKKGSFIPVSNTQGIKTHILICEGWATACTLADINPQASVLATIDAGNLTPVATEARIRWPNAEIVVCGDDDRQNPNNPGVKHATKAARAARAQLKLPRWPQNAPLHLSDFNDLVKYMEYGV